MNWTSKKQILLWKKFIIGIWSLDFKKVKVPFLLFLFVNQKLLRLFLKN